MLQRKFQIFSLLVALVFTASCSHNQQQSHTSEVDLDLDVKKFTLDNGLRLLVYENNRLPIVSYYTFFDVGGRYEENGTTGATHFLEHMMFKGAKKYGPREFDTYIERNGGSTNAYTTFDNTVYYESFPKASLDKIIDMESDRLQHLLLEEKSFEKERQVVLEERKMRYENSDKGKLYLAMMKDVFKGTPYGGSVIGDKKDVESLNRDQMMEFFKRFYTPDNAIIVISGDVDASDVYSKIKSAFGSIKKSENLAQYKQEKDAPKHYQFKKKFENEIRLHGQSENPIFMIAYKGEPVGSDKSYQLDILSSILGQSESSYLNQLWTKGKHPKLGATYVANYTMKNNGVFYIYGELLHKVSLSSFKNSYEKMTRNICDEAISERTLQKTKNQFLVQYYGSLETNAEVARFLGNNEFFSGSYDFYKKEINIINAITVSQVMKVCKEVFNDEKIFVSIWNKHPNK